MSLLSHHQETIRYGHLPLRDRVLDELADALYVMDAIAGSLDTEEANGILWIERDIREIYERINTLMKTLTH